jgi:hypothetical protein
MSHWSDFELQALIESTKLFLESIGGKDALDKELSYYGAELRKCFPTLNHVHLRLCDSIRNTARMRLVISDPRFEAISKRLLDARLDELTIRGLEGLTEIIESTCHISSNAQRDKRSWSVFKQGAVDGARYLNRFQDSRQLYSYIDSHASTVDRA